MALHRIEVKVHSRGKGGGNMIAASAYRAAERLHEPALGPVASAVHASAHIAGERLEEEHGRTWDYTAKRGVLHSEIVLPDGAPDRFRDRQTLWAEAEKAERRCDAQVGREFILTLPREMDTAANVDLVRTFAQDSLADRGMTVDFAVHQVRASDGRPHVHAHVLCAMRRCDGSGFAATKARDWNSRGLFDAIRHEWQDAQNLALELAQVAERVSCERLEVQLERALAEGDFDRAARLDHEPVPYLPRDTYFAEKAHPGGTELGRERAEVEEANAARAATYEAVREMAADVPDAPARFLEMRAASADPFAAFETWGEWARSALEQAQELAASAVERVEDAVAAAWDAIAAPLTDADLDAILAEMDREAGQEREAEQAPEAEQEPDDDPEMTALLREMELDDREQERVAELELEI